MTVSPFDAPAALYLTHADALEEACSALFFPEGSGSAMDALTDRISLYKTVLASLAESTGTIATTCDDQAHADRALATYPTYDDVQSARDDFRAAVACGDTELAAQLKPPLDDMWERRKEKVAQHADQCTQTDTSLSDVVIDAQAGEGQPLHTPRSAGGNDGLDDVRELPGSVSPDDLFMSAPEADSSTPTPSVADTDAATALSSDTSTATRTPSLYTGPAQPQMSPMHMQGGAQPAMGGGTPAFGGGVPSAAQNRGTPTSRTRGTQLNSTPVQRARERKRDTDNRSAEVPAPVVSTPVDRGTSNSGTTTKADTSGGAKTNLSASTASAPQQPLSHLNGRGPIGPVGGGPMMGSGGGVSGMKQRPEIYSTNPAQVGFDKDAISSGLLDRSTANTPEPDPVATGIPNADKVSR